MTKTIPNYLRIHRGTESVSNRKPDHDRVNQFWNAYSDATGWRIDPRAERTGEMKLLPAVSEGAIDGDSVAGVSRAAARRLAETASSIAEELQANRRAIRRQEAELASRAPIIAGDVEREALADRIETTLADAAAACGCNAAAMYMLDDDTAYLTARSVHALPTARLEDSPRELRGSRGDLESMVKGVIAINDLHAGSVDTWNCPEPCASAICAAIESDGVPIGTLWMFKNDRADFGEQHTAAARLAASKLSLELARVSLENGKPDRGRAVSIADIAHWQYESLPVGSVLAEDWRVDGMIESHREWATGWHTWDVLPDGTMMMVIAEAKDDSARGAMHAAVARAALVAHSGYRHTPAQMLQRISDTLWQTSTGEQLVSLLYARVDPETGEGEVASAGSIAAMIGSRYGYRPLVDGKSDPLNANIDTRCITETFQMNHGETLLAYTDGVLAAGASQRMLGEQIRTAMHDGESNPLSLVRRRMAEMPLKQERGAITLFRQ